MLHVQLLQKQNQELGGEINRLKGEKGKPNILPNGKKSVDISSQTPSEEKKEWQKSPKKRSSVAIGSDSFDTG
jgi:hypothetical protein